MADNILEVRNLKKYFTTAAGTLHAVDDVNFTLPRGKTLGLAGESGCGKSTIGRLICGLHAATSGELIFEGKVICKMGNNDLQALRRELQIIFQDPFSSLNPRMSISAIIAEPLLIHKITKDKGAIEAKVKEMMDIVGLSPRFAGATPTSWTAGGGSGWALPGHLF